MNSISLVISPQSVEYVGGRLDPDTDSRLNAYRLVREQQGRAGDVRWLFFAEADLRGVDGKLYATATSTCLVMAR